MEKWITIGSKLINAEDIAYFDDWGTWDTGDSVKCLTSRINVIFKTGIKLEFTKLHWFDSPFNKEYDDIKVYRDSLLTP